MPELAPITLFAFPLTLAQAHSGAAAVLVDEFDAGRFQGASDRKFVGCSQRYAIFGYFGSSYRIYSHGKFPSQIDCTPA